jgi:Bacterial Ig-like domain
VPSKTVAISSVTDDVATNGSTTGTLTNGSSTDDTTPTLAGTISAALGANEVVAIYDGATKLGNATVTTTSWTYTPTALAAGSHSFTARVENSATGAAGTASTAFTTQVFSAPTMTTTDDVGATTGTVATGTSTDDNTPTLSGVLPAALGSGEELALYDGTTKLGVATVNADKTWTYTPTTALTDGSHTLKAMVQTAGNSSSTAGKAVSATTTITVNAVVPSKTVAISSVTDDVATNGSTTGTLTNGSSTDDTTPTLAGTISAALGAGEVVAIYDGATKLGNATVTTTSWTYTPTALAAGSHSFTAKVENSATGAAGAASTAFTTQVFSVPTMTTTDDVGATTGTVATGATTDDNTPTLSGVLPAALGSGEELALYDGTTKLGVATVTGLNWTYTPTTALTDGSHTLKAMVQTTGNSSSTAGKAVSATTTITVDTSVPSKTAAISSVTDDVATNGSTTGTLTNGSSTDDTTPTLAGTISAALGAGEVVAIYDGATKLGNATVTTTSWTYTPTALAAGSHSFTAKVENSTNGAAGAASTAFVTKVLNVAGMMDVLDDVGATTGKLSSNATTDDQMLVFSGALASTLGTGEELAIYQTLSSGVMSKLGVASVTTDGSGVTTWSYTPLTNLAVGTSSFKAMIQPINDTTGVAGKVVSASSSLTIGSVDTTFNSITSTDPTSGLSVKALAVAANTTVDMQAFSHNEIDVLNLSANATAKIDLADVMQNGLNLFNASNFNAALTGTTSLHQFVVNGAAGSAVVVDSAALSGTWTKSATSVTNSGHTYDVYNNTNGTAQLLIDQLVSRSGAVI